MNEQATWTDEEDAGLTDQDIAALVFSSGHITVDGTRGRTLRLHLLSCPTCSATVKTAERILVDHAERAK